MNETANRPEVTDPTPTLEVALTYEGETVRLPMEWAEGVFSRGSRELPAWRLTMDTATVRAGFLKLGLEVPEDECDFFHECLTFNSVDGDAKGTVNLECEVRHEGILEFSPAAVEWQIVSKAA